MTYRNAGNGVIAYSYRLVDYDFEILVAGALVFGLAAAAAASGLPGAAVAYLALV